MLQVGNYLVRQTWRNAYKCTRLYATTPRLSARALELCRPDGRVGESRFMSLLEPKEEEDAHPFSLVAEDMQGTYDTVMTMLQKYIKNAEMFDIAAWHFRGLGDTVGMTAVNAILVGKTINYHMFNDGTLVDSQIKSAAIVDLIMSVTLLRDDIVDGSKLRRGKPTAHHIWSYGQVVAAGNMVLGICFAEAAKLGNSVSLSLCQMHEVAQKGQNMPYREIWADDLLGQYLMLHDHKSAHLSRHIAISQAKAVGCKEPLVENMAQFAFYMGQFYGFVDDILDFNEDVTDGRITAPAIYASKEHPELKEMMLRRFAGDGDVEKTIELVANSQGFELAREHGRMYHRLSMQHLNQMADSPYKRAFKMLSQLTLLRMEPGGEDLLLEA